MTTMDEGSQFQGLGYLRREEFHSYYELMMTLSGTSANDTVNLMVLFGSVAFFKS